MSSLGSWLLITCLLVPIILRPNLVNAKTQFLFDSGKDLSSGYRLSSPKPKKPLSRVPQHLQALQFETNEDKDVIHIIDPPAFTKSQKSSDLGNNQQLRITSREKENNVIKDDSSMVKLMKMYPLRSTRPTAAFLIQPEPETTSNLLPPYPTPKIQHPNHHTQTHQTPLKFGNFNKPTGIPYPVEGVSYHFATHQFYPLKVSAAVRHKQVIRTRPVPNIPHTKQRVRLKKSKTFQSKISHESLDYNEEIEDKQLGVIQSNVTAPHHRTQRDTSSQQESVKVMRGNLLPVALTIMKENGELLTGRALLQHITVLLKNASTSMPEPQNLPSNLNDYIKLLDQDVVLNEKEFNRVMDSSTNLTDQVLTILGVNALNDSSLLTNTYVNEYLNCIDSSKGGNLFKSIQSKFECMKRKMFDNNNYDARDPSRYSITNLPAELVYADVMRNIKNLVRPKNAIAFYSLPVDELTQLQQVVLPIEEYISQLQNSRFTQRSYYDPPLPSPQKVVNYETIRPRMPIFYVVKPDGRVYQTKENRNSNPTILKGFPDIPNADVFVDGSPRNQFYESVFY